MTPGPPRPSTLHLLRKGADPAATAIRSSPHFLEGIDQAGWARIGVDLVDWEGARDARELGLLAGAGLLRELAPVALVRAHRLRCIRDELGGGRTGVRWAIGAGVSSSRGSLLRREASMTCWSQSQPVLS